MLQNAPYWRFSQLGYENVVVCNQCFVSRRANWKRNCTMYFYQIQTQHITKGSLSKRKKKITSQKKKMGGEVKKKDDFEICRTTFQVIFVGGCENKKKVQKFCKYICHARVHWILKKLWNVKTNQYVTWRLDLYQTF